MAVKGWLLDKSAAVRAHDPAVGAALDELAGKLCLCPTALLEQLFSTRSAAEYDQTEASLRASLIIVDAPADILDRALALQRDLAHHHGMWHRVPIPDLLIAETALHHGLGVVHVDGDFTRIAEVRPLIARRLG
ncbi:MAG: PIN domain-containing protein [Pseudonocardiales bacterium]|nr:PIN domain-containing protein [Pseudonocardiales bacterium]